MCRCDEYQSCPECHTIGDDWLDDALAREFEPCASYDPAANHTEIVLRDTLIVWVYGLHSDLGYDSDGKLVAMRVMGDVTKRNT